MFCGCPITERKYPLISIVCYTCPITDLGRFLQVSSTVLPPSHVDSFNVRFPQIFLFQPVFGHLFNKWLMMCPIFYSLVNNAKEKPF